MKYLYLALLFFLLTPALAVAATATSTPTLIASDVLKVGPNVAISEAVAGDVLAAGGNIIVNAPVAGDIRVAGGQVTINSKVGGNVTVAGGQVSFGPMSEVAGSVGAWAGQVRMAGTVNGDVYVQTGKGVDLQIDPNAVIGGTLTYKATDKNEALLAGTTAKEVIFQERPRRANDFAGVGYFFHLISLFGLLVVGLVLVSIAPKALRRSIEESLNHAKQNIWWGLLALFAVPVGVIFLLFTLIGIPLALILLAGYLMVIYLATVFSGLVVGDYIFRYFKKGSHTVSLFWVMMMGVLVLWLLGRIPFVGGIVMFIATVWGMGMMIRLKWQALKQIEE
ncbi:MAG: polymer-forming cytoskeletal protein [Patescibacteria group bacterium]